MSVPANFFTTTTVTASPADSTETVIATLSGLTELLPGLDVKLIAQCNITTQAATTAVVLKLRRTGVSGTQVGTTCTHTIPGGAAAVSMLCTAWATDNLGTFSGEVYVLTATCTSAAGASTVNTVRLEARVD